MNIIKVVISGALVVGIGMTAWCLSKLAESEGDTTEKKKTEKDPKERFLDKFKKANPKKPSKASGMLERLSSLMGLNQILKTGTAALITAVAAFAIYNLSSGRTGTLGKLNEKDANNIFERSNIGHHIVSTADKKRITGFEFFKYLKRFLGEITYGSIDSIYDVVKRAATFEAQHNIAIRFQEKNFTTKKVLGEVYGIIFETDKAKAVLDEVVKIQSEESLREVLNKKTDIMDRYIMCFIYKILNAENYTNYQSYASDFFTKIGKDNHIISHFKSICEIDDKKVEFDPLSFTKEKVANYNGGIQFFSPYFARLYFEIIILISRIITDEAILDHTNLHRNFKRF